jgi:small subunit ribosomal protein S16
VSLAGWSVACLNFEFYGSHLRAVTQRINFFNIVVADKRTRRDGRFIERIGFYNPIATANEESIRIAQDRLTYWRGVGAQASPTVERLIKQAAPKSA